MITRTDIRAHLDYGVKTGFVLGTKSYTPLRTPFCGSEPSTGAFELYADMGPVGWPRQNAGTIGSGGTDSRTGAPQAGDLQSGESVTVTGGYENSMMVFNVDWEIVKAVTQNSIDDDRTGNLETWARSAGMRYEKHKDYLAFNALNNGESITAAIGPCYDGLSLFNDSHVDKGAIYTTVQDNKLATILTLANFNSAYIAGSKFRDGDGQPVGLSHDLLIYPTDLRDIAKQIVDNPEKAGVGNRDINPNFGEVVGLKAPGGWLDTTAWFIVDASMPEKPIFLQIRKEPLLEILVDPLAGDGGVRYYKFHARYQIACGDWRLIVEGNS